MSDALETARAYGLIAQGYKILRNLALKRAENDKNGPTPDPELSAEKEPEIPLDLASDEKGVFLEFPLSPAEFLTQPRTKAYGVNFVRVLFSSLLGGKVRASPTSKLVWVHDPSHRRGWASTDQEALGPIFDRLKDFHQECVGLLNTTFGEFCKDVGKVHLSKFARRHKITEAKLEFKALLKWARTEHSRLPSVCARKAPKKN